MRWGISFNIAATYESDLWGLPPPSSTEVVQKWDGTQMINVLYHFQYSPQSWKEWQRVAGIKVQIKNKIKHVEFQEYELLEVDGKIYTVSELGKHFREFVKFPKPLFPGKRESYRMLCRHAKRLYYENLLHEEQLIATSIRFNATDPEGVTQTVKRALSAYKFALDHLNEWKVKLGKVELIAAHRKGAAKTHQLRRDKSASKRERAKSLRAEGMIFSRIALALDVSLRTVKRWLK